jgi:glycosyltransferase involved in cell wall biosynthesis/uncharacterized protein YqgV (UPF0045/DUF77 family)
MAMLSWESMHSISVGGVAAHVTELSVALARRGHDVHIFTRRAPGQSAHERIDGVSYHRCTYPGHPDFIDDINNMCRAFVDRFFDIEDLIGHFDIVHAHDWLTANAMIWIKKGRGHKCVLTIHSTEYARCGNTFPGGRSARVRDQERAGTYWADQVIAVSNATGAEIRWMYEVPEYKTHTVYNGVNARRFDGEIDAGAAKRRYAIGPVDPTVLFCGRLEHQKGPDLLVEAIPAVLRIQPRTKFVFAGDGGMRGQLENRARQLGVGDAVRFLGVRNGQELVTLYKMADAVCVPSRNEPFGIVVLEAWSARCPVVVSQIGGPNEYVHHEETGLKIYPHVESVAWGLSSLFSDFERARRLGENGRRTVEDQFTWDHIAFKTLGVYDPSYGVFSDTEEMEPAEVAAAAEAEMAAEAEAEVEAVEPSPVELKSETAEPAPVVLALAAEEPSVAEESPALLVAAADPGAPVLVSAKLALRIGDSGSGQLLSQAIAACKQTLAGAGLRVSLRGNALFVQGEWNAVTEALRQCYAAIGSSAGVQVTTSIKPAAPAKEPVSAAVEPDTEEGRLGLRAPGTDPRWPAARPRPRKDAATLSVA